METILSAPLNRPLTVRSFSVNEIRDLSDLESRLMHLGFFDGETIRVVKKAPLSQGPLLVEVRGRMVALSAEEAKLVSIEVQA